MSFINQELRCMKTSIGPSNTPLVYNLNLCTLISLHSLEHTSHMQGQIQAKSVKKSASTIFCQQEVNR